MATKNCRITEFLVPCPLQSISFSFGNNCSGTSQVPCWAQFAFFLYLEYYISEVSEFLMQLQVKGSKP